MMFTRYSTGGRITCFACSGEHKLKITRFSFILSFVWFKDYYIVTRPITLIRTTSDVCFKLEVAGRYNLFEK